MDWWMLLWRINNFAVWAVLLYAAYRYWQSVQEPQRQPTYLWPAVGAAALMLLKVVLMAFWQRSIWLTNSLGRDLLERNLTAPSPFYYLSPWLFDRSGGYFISYVLSRFLLAVILSFVVSLAFYYLLLLLKKGNERFFLPGETRLGFLCALLSGWPGFVFFVPAVFLSVIVVSAVRMAMGYKYTTLGYPMLIAAAVALAASSFLQSFFGLWVLKV